MKIFLLFLFLSVSSLASDFTVNGNSMYPVLHDGQSMVMVDTNFAHVKRHDICVYYNPILRKLVIHEAFHRVGGKWEMLGVNNPVSDPGFMNAKNFQCIVTIEKR